MPKVDVGAALPGFAIPPGSAGVVVLGGWVFSPGSSVEGGPEMGPVTGSVDSVAGPGGVTGFCTGQSAGVSVVGVSVGSVGVSVVGVSAGGVGVSAGVSTGSVSVLP